MVRRVRTAIAPQKRDQRFLRARNDLDSASDEAEVLHVPVRIACELLALQHHVPQAEGLCGSGRRRLRRIAAQLLPRKIEQARRAVRELGKLPESMYDFHREA